MQSKLVIATAVGMGCLALTFGTAGNASADGVDWPSATRTAPSSVDMQDGFEWRSGTFSTTQSTPDGPPPSWRANNNPGVSVDGVRIH